MRLLPLFLAFLLSACSSMPVGGFCYLPYGQPGQCTVTILPTPTVSLQEL